MSAGSSATYTITVSPKPAPFANTCELQLFGSAHRRSLHLHPTSVTPGSASVATTLTISTTARTLASAIPPTDSRQAVFATWLGTSLVGIVVLPNKQRRSIRLVLGILLLGSTLGAGCGGGTSQGSTPPSSSSNPDGTPAGTYTVTVTAPGNGSLTHNTTAVLTVN